jgi:hypothetical protein
MAQSASLEMGARAHAMGGASGCLSDVWSITNNIAGLADARHAAAGFSYHAVPSFKHFNRTAAVFAVPFSTGVAGASVFRFGDDLFNEQSISLGFANTFGLASLGLKIDWRQYRADGLPARNAFTVSFGGLAKLTSQLLFGAHIVNINQPIINTWTEERVPTRLVAGLAFAPSKKVIVAFEVEKEPDYPATFKSGLEYKASGKIVFRTGFNLHPQAGFFGAGFKSGKLDLDYALQYNQPTGLSHQATISLQFGKS